VGSSRRFYTSRIVSPRPDIPDAAPPARAPPEPQQVAARIRAIAAEMGFQRCGIAGIELAEDEAHLRDWLAQGLYGTMDWMARHGTLRARPAELLPGGWAGIRAADLFFALRERLEGPARAYVKSAISA